MPNVVWPKKGIDFAVTSATVVTQMEKAIERGPLLTSRGSWIYEIEGNLASLGLLWDDLRLNGSRPVFIISTDGSGTLSGVGAGGFGCVVLTRTKMFAIVGGKDITTSGEMEMAGAGEAVNWLSHKNGEASLMLADYMTWTNADLDAIWQSRASGMKRAPVWAWITEGLLGSVMSHPLSSPPDRFHTPAHKGVGGNWGSNLNEIADRLADLGKRLRRSDVILNWSCPTIVFSPAPLTRPVTAKDLSLAARRRKSKSADASGLTNDLITKAPSQFFEALCSEDNLALFNGEFPSNDSPQGVLGRNQIIGKSDGGARFLTIPDCCAVLFSSVLADRLLNALMDAASVSKAQKCNIRNTAGVDELVFLVLGSLFDFHDAALCQSLQMGAVRLFILNDIAKAFDRVQPAVLLQAIRVVLGEENPMRFLSVILSMYSKIKIIVTVEGMSTVVDKEAGVAQGDPLSAILFIILMEYARMLHRPESRSRIKVLYNQELVELVMEVDYADDQIRVVDEVLPTVGPCVAAATLLKDLQNCLWLVGLEINLSKIQVLALRYTPNRGVYVFDPMLSLPGPDGELKMVTALTENSWFRIAGVLTNFRGEFKASEDLVTRKDKDKIKLISDSGFPIRAKLEALRSVADRSSEYLYYNAWINKQTAEDIDKFERHSLRAFFGNLNLPNAYIKGELRLGMRTDRCEIIHLSGFVRRLFSRDPRVKLFALRMAKATCPPDVPGALLDPRFFNWSRIKCHSNELGILAVGSRIAGLARKWHVGIWSENGNIHVSYKGACLVDPLLLIKTLTKQAERDHLGALERRISTVKSHTPPDRFAVSWGLAGLEHLFRPEDIAFLKASCFSDAEVQILISLRLLLWPTPFRDSIRSKNNISGLCKCGAVGTATHFLSVPQHATAHGELLRSVRDSRHAALVRAIGDWLPIGLPNWKIVSAESLEPDPDFQDVRDVIRDGRLRGVLSLPEEKELDAPPQHFKPDFLLARRHREELSFLILDACTGSSDKLFIENQVATVINRLNVLSPDLFDPDGKVLPKGIESINKKYVGVKVDLVKAGSLKLVRYVKRYNPLKQLLDRSFAGPRVVIHPIAISTDGWIPSFTRKILEDLSDKKLAATIAAKLQVVAWRFAILAYKAWRSE